MSEYYVTLSNVAIYISWNRTGNFKCDFPLNVIYSVQISSWIFLTMDIFSNGMNYGYTCKLSSFS